MKKTMTSLRMLLLIVASVLISCKKDKQKVLPTVLTATPTEITINSAKVGGNITSDGNDAITERGIVYSKVVSTPTLANDKLASQSTSNNFEVVLTGLTSGSTYYLRAYATNSVGTSYGEVINLMTGNAPPLATGVAVNGTPAVNKTLTAAYSYSDAENNPESGTTFQWYVANDAAGASATPIANATQATFIVQDAQQGKYIAVAVTPKSSAGSMTGTEVRSAYIGAVGEATTVTFVYNGQSVTYGIITSAKTGKKWLDRNLGAPSPAANFNDFTNYGDLFQWGRLADGHQLTNRAASSAETSSINGSTQSQSSSDNPGSNKFMGVESNPSDWRNPANDNLWQGVNGINNPCPTGWRIPTKGEWSAEGIVDAAEGFAKLKLTFGGYRWYYDGSYSGVPSYGTYWSSTINPDVSANVYTFQMRNSSTQESYLAKASGGLCRCIKN